MREKKPPRPMRVECVYAGAMLHQGSVMHSYVQFDAEGNLGEAVLYGQALSHHRPGSIIQFDAVGDRNAIVKETAIFKGEWRGNPEQVMTWIASTDALLKSEEAYKHSKNPLFEGLGPIQAAYDSMGSRERAVFLAAVVAYICGEG